MGDIVRTLALMGAALIGTSAQAQSLPPHNWMTPPQVEGGQAGRVGYLDGNTFLRQCENSRVACVTYLQGVNDGLLAVIVGTNRDMIYCIPSRATIDQVADIVIRYVEAHPERRHLQMPVLMTNALADVWPQCGS